MILKIADQPFITLDKYLNIDKLLSLKNEFEFLLASSWHDVRVGVWQSGGHSPADIKKIQTGEYKSAHRENDWLYFVTDRANQERLTDLELDKHLKYFEEKQDRQGLTSYFKLRYKSFDPYNILNVRKTTSGNYATDSLLFTDKDWKTYNWADYFVRDFPQLKEFIESLPLVNIGVVTIFYNEHYVPLGHHRDCNYNPKERGDFPDTFPHRQEFIWFRFDLDRPFNLYDFDLKTGEVNECVPVQGYSAFFNHHNWHGCHEPFKNSSITLKVEGQFADEFRKQIGIDHIEQYYK